MGCYGSYRSGERCLMGRSWFGRTLRHGRCGGAACASLRFRRWGEGDSIFLPRRKTLGMLGGVGVRLVREHRTLWLVLPFSGFFVFLLLCVVV